MQNLPLDRPLVCFDLETTGTDIVKDRIVQIGVLRVDPDGSRSTFDSLVNPQCPIPPGATAIHGISDADVAGKPTFIQLAAQLGELFADADLAGFNSVRFDLPLLVEEFRRAGHEFDPSDRRHLDAMIIFHRMEPRHLSAAYRFYCDGDLADAHDALADADATLSVLDAQLAHYPDLPQNMDELHEYCHPDQGRWLDSTRRFAWEEGGEVIFNFGKYKGQRLREITRTAPNYLQWIVDKDFSADVKHIASEALEGRFPRKE